MKRLENGGVGEGGETQEELVAGVCKYSIREAAQSNRKISYFVILALYEHSSKNRVLQCIYTGMRRITFRSTTDRIYDGGAIR